MFNKNYLRSSILFVLIMTVVSQNIYATWWQSLFNDLSEQSVRDIKQDNNNIIVTMSVPTEIRAEDIVVEISDQTLYVHGNSKKEEEVTDKLFYKKSMAHSSFNRSFYLDCLVDEKESFAELSNGILMITMKKIAPIKSASSKIRVTEK